MMLSNADSIFENLHGCHIEVKFKTRQLGNLKKNKYLKGCTLFLFYGQRISFTIRLSLSSQNWTSSLKYCKTNSHLNACSRVLFEQGKNICQRIVVLHWKMKTGHVGALSDWVPTKIHNHSKITRSQAIFIMDRLNPMLLMLLMS